MKCKYCGKECLENELLNEVCFECQTKQKVNGFIKNPVSHKIKRIVSILYIVGYVFSIILGISFLVSEEIFSGIFVIIFGILGTLLSTIFLEAIAEIIQLLQDLKINKTMQQYMK